MSEKISEAYWKWFSVDDNNGTENAYYAGADFGFELAKKELEEQIKELSYYKEMWQSIAGKANLDNIVKAAKEIEEQIKEAREVIKFYSHRYDINGKENIFEFHQFDSACDACRETCYGLKAKEYLEKWK